MKKKKKKYEWKELISPSVTYYKGYDDPIPATRTITAVEKKKKKDRKYQSKIKELEGGGLASLLNHALDSSIQKMTDNMMKTNSFLEWAMGGEERKRQHYMDMSVSLDFILQTKEPYYG